MQSDPRPEVVPGERIFLTKLRKDDVALFAQWFTDLELTAYLGRLGWSYSAEQEQSWYDSLDKDPHLVTFGIVERETGQLIGSVSLMHIDHTHGRAELGIAIGDRAAWNKGYGTEAVRLMAEYGCFFQNLHTIYLWFVEFNERGQRAYEKAGFKLAGRLRKAYQIGGERYDSVYMDVTRDELDLSRMRSMIGLLREG